MRAWIQSSLFGVPLPDRILPSVSRTSSVLALARPALRRADFSENPGAPVDLLRREDRPGEFVVARLVGKGPAADLHRFRRGFAAQRGRRLCRKLAQPVAVEGAEPPGAHAMQREKRETRNPQEVFLGLRPRRIIRPARPAGDDADYPAWP